MYVGYERRSEGSVRSSDIAFMSISLLALPLGFGDVLRACKSFSACFCFVIEEYVSEDKNVFGEYKLMINS